MLFALPRGGRRKMKTPRMTLRVERRLRSWSAPLLRCFRNDVWLLVEACDWLAFPTRRVAKKLTGSPEGTCHHQHLGRLLDGEARHERNHRTVPTKMDAPRRRREKFSRPAGAKPYMGAGSGGCARSSLHHRLISLIPPGWADSRSGANDLGNAPVAAPLSQGLAHFQDQTPSRLRPTSQSAAAGAHSRNASATRHLSGIRVIRVIRWPILPDSKTTP